MIGRQTQFVEKMGVFFEGEGFPRIGGRIFGLLMLSEEPRSIDDIALALGVSKASVSTDTRLLERWAMVERVGRPGDRRAYYHVVPALPQRTMERRLQRIRRFRTLTAEARATLPTGKGELRNRLMTLEAAYDRVLEAIETALEAGTHR
jgi:DNA-binding transcriptional regulator GbsR (MarR family)